MKIAAVALFAVLWLIPPVPTLAGPSAAGLGAKLADLLAGFVPVELYRQRLIAWRLSGGEPPDWGAARRALTDGSTLLKSLEDEIAGPPWEGVLGEIQTVSRVAARALSLAPAADAPPRSYDELARCLADLRRGLDGLVVGAAEAAESLGQGWEFQAAFIAETVLLSPSPLYLQLPREGRDYLSRFPPGIPPEVRRAVTTLISGANRSLTPAEEAAVRAAARAIIEGLVGKVRGRP